MNEYLDYLKDYDFEYIMNDGTVEHRHFLANDYNSAFEKAKNVYFGNRYFTFINWIND